MFPAAVQALPPHIHHPVRDAAPPVLHSSTPAIALGVATVAVGINVPAPPSTSIDVVVVTTTGSTLSTSTAVASNDSPMDEPSGECRLLGPFALLVQLALGGLALLSLVYKRWRERPQRPLKIWFFDVSKQVFGSVLVHVANVFMSMLTSGRLSIKAVPGVAQTAQRLLLRAEGGDDYTPNPCSFYLLNLAIDTTLGIPILILLLRICTGLVAYTPWGRPAESIQSGNYGNPPNAWWWLKQSVIYFCGLFGMKICVLIIFLMLPWISRIGDWALGWTEGNERLQIIFVMMLFPLIMNAMQYYIIDSFIKKKEFVGQYDELGAEISTGRDIDGAAYDTLDVSEEVDDGDSDGDARKPEPQVSTVRQSVRKDGEYDPAVDGDSQTAVGSSSSQSTERGTVLPKELYPHE